jgi:hypothetical protein
VTTHKLNIHASPNFINVNLYRYSAALNELNRTAQSTQYPSLLLHRNEIQ